MSRWLLRGRLRLRLLSRGSERTIEGNPRPDGRGYNPWHQPGDIGLSRVGGDFAEAFGALRGDQARGEFSASAGGGFENFASLRGQSWGLDVQAVVGFALGGEQGARFVDSLLEYGHSEGAPEAFAVFFSEIRLAGTH